MSNNNAASLSLNGTNALPKIRDDTVNMATELINNFFQTAPEGILFGSTILAIFTQNMAFFVLALAVLVFKLLNGVIGQFLLQIAPELYEGEVYGARQSCDFPFATLRKLEGLNSTLRNSAVPSSTTFVFLATLFYMLACVHKFKDTLDILKEKNPTHASVLTMSFIMTVLLTLSYIIWRKKTGCDSASVLLLTLGAAAASGPLIAWVFEHIFGKSGVNLLGLPILERDIVNADGNIATCGSSA